MNALTSVVQKFVDVLEDDVWKLYIRMKCPNPEIHEMTGCCYDCDNKHIELEGVQNRVDICRLSMCCKDLRSVVDNYN